MKHEVIECPVYYTQNRSSNAPILKLAIPEHYSDYTRCRIYVDVEMNSMTLLMDGSGPFAVQTAKCYKRPLVLITKAIRQLFIDPQAIKGATLKGVCYPDRIDFILPDTKRVLATKFGYEVL